MARVAVLGITGRVGSRIGAELLRRGHIVTGLARTVQAVPARRGLTVNAVDATDSDALAVAVRSHDALVSATRFVDGITASALITAAKRGGIKRILVVGGAGSLLTAPDGPALVDTPDFPPAFRTEALAGRTFLETLRGERELDWTFLSPSAVFEPGERTGHFRLGVDELLIDAQGHSHISMEDFAIAMVDEIENPRHLRSRFTVGY